MLPQLHMFSCITLYGRAHQSSANFCNFASFWRKLFWLCVFLEYIAFSCATLNLHIFSWMCMLMHAYVCMPEMLCKQMHLKCNKIFYCKCKQMWKVAYTPCAPLHFGMYANACCCISHPDYAYAYATSHTYIYAYVHRCKIEYISR